eukprot:403367823
MESIKKVSLLQYTKSKYILGEILSFTFYCHQGYQLLCRLNKESYNLLKNDDYLIKTFKKEVREVLIQSKQEDLTILSKMNFTYDYRIVLYENKMIPLMQQAQTAFLSKQNNMNFDFESLVIQKDNGWETEKRNEFSSIKDISEIQRNLEIYQKQLTEDLIGVGCLIQLRKLKLKNSNFLFIPFAEFFKNLKNKTKLETLEIHSRIEKQLLSLPQIITGFSQLLDSALRYHNIQQLVIELGYFDNQILQELVKSLNLAQNLSKIDITISVKGRIAPVGDNDIIKAIYDIIGSCKALRSLRFRADLINQQSRPRNYNALRILTFGLQLK